MTKYNVQYKRISKYLQNEPENHFSYNCCQIVKYILHKYVRRKNSTCNLKAVKICRRNKLVMKQEEYLETTSKCKEVTAVSLH